MAKRAGMRRWFQQTFGRVRLEEAVPAVPNKNESSLLVTAFKRLLPWLSFKPQPLPSKPQLEPSTSSSLVADMSHTAHDLLKSRSDAKTAKHLDEHKAGVILEKSKQKKPMRIRQPFIGRNIYFMRLRTKEK